MASVESVIEDLTPEQILEIEQRRITIPPGDILGLITIICIATRRTISFSSKEDVYLLYLKRLLRR